MSVKTLVIPFCSTRVTLGQLHLFLQYWRRSAERNSAWRKSSQLNWVQKGGKNGIWWHQSSHRLQPDREKDDSNEERRTTHRPRGRVPELPTLLFALAALRVHPRSAWCGTVNIRPAWYLTFQRRRLWLDQQNNVIDAEYLRIDWANRARDWPQCWSRELKPSQSSSCWVDTTRRNTGENNKIQVDLLKTQNKNVNKRQVETVFVFFKCLWYWHTWILANKAKKLPIIIDNNTCTGAKCRLTKLEVSAAAVRATNNVLKMGRIWAQ